MVYRRKKTHYGDTHLKRRWSTKRRTKDLDLIDQDILPENSKKLINQEVDFDKPGAAQHYCVHCARYFINITALEDHFRTKVHKRRLKALELEPYTIEDSQRAAGFGSWKAPVKRKIATITKLEEESDSGESSKRMKIDDDDDGDS
ncbi:zinc finger protein 593 homolog [Leptinotarsa decemlineata]|uniref:zinc finger protein 593 homolog n=1 Tax=Leptinotarsa decemlineata TaxID=7539 RepID=UPI003D305661